MARDRQEVQDVLAGEETEMGGLGAERGATLLRASAAGVYASCLLSGFRLRLMALEEGDAAKADLFAAVAEEGSGGEGSEEGEGTAGEVEWDDTEAMCMFGVRVSGERMAFLFLCHSNIFVFVIPRRLHGKGVAQD